MQTSRNPKVLNNALKYKLQPILDKIENLEDMEKSYDESMSEQKQKEDELKDKANSEFDKYGDRRNGLIRTIDNSELNLTNLINNTLYNPNEASSSEEGGSSGSIIDESKLISDKIVKCAGYGFVKEGVDYCMFGLTGKGLAIGTDPGKDLEYEWRNPENDLHPFPSYYVNDILTVDTNTAFISTNNGIVIYKFDTDTYNVYDTSCGLPNNEVISIVKVCDNSEEKTGFIALTYKGVAYSPTGEKWTNIDSSFGATPTCFSSTNFINTPQNILFIGTTNGIYYILVDELLNTSTRKIYSLKSVFDVLPSNYIYCLAYDVDNDILSVATTGGALVVKNILNYMNSVSVNEEDVSIFTNRNGLVGTSCYSVAYTINHDLILGTANGLSVTSNYSSFKSLTTSKNELGGEDLLSSHICNKIIRKTKDTYTIIHGIGLSESISI